MLQSDGAGPVPCCRRASIKNRVESATTGSAGSITRAISSHRTVTG